MTSTSDEELTPERERRRCFVIGPIGNRFAAPGAPEREQFEEAIEVLEVVIEPACRVVGLIPVRADGLTQAGEITEQIFRRLRDDDVVIADLTNANPNVMYELGLRHTRNALTVQIGEYRRLPFDITAIRTVQFSRSTHGLITARDELIAMLESGLTGEYDPVTATRVWNEGEQVETIAGPPESSDTAESADAEPSEPPGFIDLIAEGEANQQALGEATIAIGERIAELGRATEVATQRIAESDARGAGMQGRLTVAAQFAQEIGPIAEHLEDDVNNYEAAMTSVSGGILALIQRIEEDPTQLPDAMNLARLLRQLAARSREGLESQQGFVAAMTEAARASRVMREPVGRVSRALDRFAVASQAIDQWDRRLQALGVETPATDWVYPDANA